MNIYVKSRGPVARIGLTNSQVALLAFKVALVLIALLIPDFAWAVAAREM